MTKGGTGTKRWITSVSQRVGQIIIIGLLSASGLTSALIPVGNTRAKYESGRVWFEVDTLIIVRQIELSRCARPFPTSTAYTGFRSFPLLYASSAKWRCTLIHLLLSLSLSLFLSLSIYLPLLLSYTPLLPLLYTSTSRFSILYSADRHLLAAFCPRLASSCFQGVPLSSLSIACHLTVLGYSPRFTSSLFADFFRRLPFFPIFFLLSFSFFLFLIVCWEEEFIDFGNVFCVSNWLSMLNYLRTNSIEIKN